MNVVRWGGGGIGGRGVLYTASSDRTVRIWDPNGVSTLVPIAEIGVRSHAVYITLTRIPDHRRANCYTYLKIMLTGLQRSH